MVLTYNKIVVSLFFSLFLVHARAPAVSKTSSHGAGQHLIRVLLEERAAEGTTWFVDSLSGFSVTVFDTKIKRYRVERDSCQISYKAGSYTINGKRLPGASLQIRPRGNNRLVFQDKEYEGSCLIHVRENKIFLINLVPLETYIYSVLHSESWPGWPCEVNKAFAIASRSYAAAEMVEARKKGKLYDIKNTNIHQTYAGHHKTYAGHYTQRSFQEAVESTAGLILTHKRQPIVAMFDSCCGGIVPAHMHGVDFVKAPYLARNIACTYCKDSKLYRWKLEINHSDLEALFAKQNLVKGALHDVSVAKKDKAGIVHELSVHGSKGTVSLSGKKLYSLLKPLKSFSYAVRKQGKKIIFEGPGFGHHLGMCQWGAKNMTDRGFTHLQVLNFYYPNVQFMKLRYDSIAIEETRV
jgi:stage II sporulation protein D